MTDSLAVQAAVFDTVVVPAFAHVFGTMAVESLVVSDEARVAHIGCRTGYPDAGVLERLPNSHVIGRDSSAAAVELARTKASAAGYRDRANYAVGKSDTLPDGAFSHALTLLPGDVDGTLREHHRLLAPAGQSVVAVLLRDSFDAVFDLLREFALRHDADRFSLALEQRALGFLTENDLRKSAEQVGFHHLEVHKRSIALSFNRGRDVLESAAMQRFLLGDLEAFARATGLDREAFAYLTHAFDTYYGGQPFEIGYRAAVISSRR